MSKLYTIGHSTRAIEEFLNILQAFHVQLVVDVRTVPKSRRNPQFGEDQLADSLKHSNIDYKQIKKLGGLQHASQDSINTGWHNMSFRGYADYMATTSFKEGLQQIKELAENHVAVILCAEAVPWRCHRSLIADALTLQGWEVLHIHNQTTAKVHQLTPFLKVQNGEITYPAPEQEESQ